MSLPLSIQILLFGMPNKNKSNVLNKKVSREEYLQKKYMKFNHWILLHFPMISLTAILILLIIGVLTCYYFGISCVESGSLRNFINWGVL